MYRVAQISGFLLCLIGVAIYLIMDPKSMTALIPSFFGVAILICSSFMRTGNKVAAHIAVVLTFLLIGGMGKPISGIDWANMDATNYLSLLGLLVAVVAFVLYIKSFMDARKNRS